MEEDMEMLVLHRLTALPRAAQSSPHPIPAPQATETGGLSSWIPLFLRFISAGQKRFQLKVGSCKGADWGPAGLHCIVRCSRESSGPGRFTFQETQEPSCDLTGETLTLCPQISAY